jgi:hypothetical protein
MQRPTAWKIVAVGATVAGLGLGGATLAMADDGPSTAPVTPISVSSADPAAAHPAFTAVDASPESADSPLESPIDSPDSPFDSPDDQDTGDDTPDNTPDDLGTPDDTP